MPCCRCFPSHLPLLSTLRGNALNPPFFLYYSFNGILKLQLLVHWTRAPSLALFSLLPCMLTISSSYLPFVMSPHDRRDMTFHKPLRHSICLSSALNSSNNKGDSLSTVLTLESDLFLDEQTQLFYYINLRVCVLTLWQQIWHNNYKNAVSICFFYPPFLTFCPACRQLSYSRFPCRQIQSGSRLFKQQGVIPPHPDLTKLDPLANSILSDRAVWRHGHPM